MITVKIPLAVGVHRRTPTKQDMQENIDVVQKVLNNQPLSMYESSVLVGVQSILQALQEQL